MRESCPAALAVACLALGIPGGASGDDPVERLTDPGFEFTHVNGMKGELYFPEMTGQGGALLDYDGDGDLDAYLVQGGELGVEPVPPERRGLDRLLRNDSTASGRRWVDVTSSSGLRGLGYGMAVAVGDVDADGAPDLFLGNYGPNQLWRNRGDGRFEDVSERLAETSPRWTTSAVFLDDDGDGLDDLYVVNYVEYSVATAPSCYAASSQRDYCGPSGFASQADVLLRNRGAVFEDVSLSAGVAAVAGSGLGVAVLDVEGDGRLEVYVANDGQPNFLWRRGGDGRWMDDALLAGVAVNRRGEPEASMGVAAGDYDRDGDEDVVVTHLDGETHTLYVNDGAGLFDDRTIDSGLAAPSLDRTGFGVVWVDLDHDGWLDLAVANGAVRIQPTQAAAGDAYPLKQANQLFSNRGGRFVELDETVFSAELAVSRGVIGGDIDNDGDRDLIVTNNAGAARLFGNRAASTTNWVGLAPARPAHQAVTADFGDSRMVFRASSSGSYASASDPRVVVAGDGPPRSLSVVIDGRVLRFVAPPAGRYLRVGKLP